MTKSPVAAVLPLFLATRLALFAIAAAAAAHVPIDRHESLGFHLPRQPHVLLEAWARYDACWYVAIAERGYRGALEQSGDMRAAFFPLFPWLIAAATKLVHIPMLAALLVANASFFVFLCILWTLVELDCGSGVARRTIWVYLLFPSAFFLSGAYSESVLLALSAGAILMARQERWLAAGLLAGLAALDRAIGVVVVVPLVAECLAGRAAEPDTRRWGRLSTVLAPTVVAGVVYLAFARWAFGDALAYVQMETAVRGPLTPPWQGFVELWRVGPRLHAFDHSLFDAALAIAATAVLPAVFARVRASYGAYALLVIMIPLSSSLMSFSRLLLPAFPYAILLAQRLDRPATPAAVLVPLGVLEALLTAAFATWHWVA